MPLTELALLHLPPATPLTSPALRSILRTAKTTLQTYTGRTFHYYQQLEDPSLVYIIGEWDSLDQHMNAFIPSPENQAILQSVKDVGVTVEWLLHIDVPHAASPLLREGDGEGVCGISRYFVKKGERESFVEAFEANKRSLQECVTEGRIGGGWRVDGEEGKEEFVLFTPWVSVEQQLGFVKTGAFEKFGRIPDHVTNVDIKHAKLLDV